MVQSITLAVNFTVGLPVILYCLILAVIAFRNDKIDRGAEEANAIKGEWKKSKASGKINPKYKRRLFYLFIIYEFFQLASFGFMQSVPWSFSWPAVAANSLSLIPPGTSFVVFFWLGLMGELSFIAINLVINRDYFFKHLPGFLIKALGWDTNERESQNEQGVQTSKHRKKWNGGKVPETLPLLWKYRKHIRMYGGQIMLEILFIPVIRMCWEMLNCVESGTPGVLVLDKFNTIVCYQPAHIVHLVLGLLLIFVLFPITLIHALAKNEFDPDFRFLPVFNTTIITLKFLLVAISVVSVWPNATQILFAFALSGLFLANIILQPCLGQGGLVNHLRSSSFIGASWSSWCAVIVIEAYQSPYMLLAYFFVLAILMVIFFFVSRWRAKILNKNLMASLLVTNSSSPDMNEHQMKQVALNIAKISLLGKKRQEIVEAGGMQSLKEWAQSENRDVQKNAVGAIRNLALNPDTVPIIISEGTVEILIKVLRTSKYDEVHEEVIRILANLSNTEENRLHIASFGAIELLVEMLTSQHKSEIQKNAARALRNLALTYSLKEQIVKAGAIEHLLKNANITENLELVETALRAIESLARCKEQRAEILKSVNGEFLNLYIFSLQSLPDKATSVLLKVGMDTLLLLTMGISRKQRKEIRKNLTPLTEQLSQIENLACKDALDKLLSKLDRQKTQGTDTIDSKTGADESPMLTSSNSPELHVSLGSTTDTMSSSTELLIVPETPVQTQSHTEHPTSTPSLLSLLESTTAKTVNTETNPNIKPSKKKKDKSKHKKKEEEEESEEEIVPEEEFEEDISIKNSKAGFKKVATITAAQKMSKKLKPGAFSRPTSSTTSNNNNSSNTNTNTSPNMQSQPQPHALSVIIAQETARSRGRSSSVSSARRPSLAPNTNTNVPLISPPTSPSLSPASLDSHPPDPLVLLPRVSSVKSTPRESITASSLPPIMRNNNTVAPLSPPLTSNNNAWALEPSGESIKGKKPKKRSSKIVNKYK
eukprot:TRINITY_DN6929_c0_g1_i6.p1 TRINITY_DN6929_c0_g1~~TRINITY_DN6929_c0_g1_i6.p1  ORF type:complete len:997 (+),score=215.20 TRINITY_DN6929_c0_g1_i6:237-3227(+)